MEFNLNKFKNRILTEDAISLLYLIVAGCLCHILPIPEMVKGFLALPGLLIIPHLCGKTTTILIQKLLKIDLDLQPFSNFIICWCIGIILMIVIAYFLNWLWLFDTKTYVVLILFLMIPAVFYKKKEEKSLIRFIKAKGGYITILLALVIGVMGFLFITYFSPYPYQFGCDYHIHMYYSTQIIEKNFIQIVSSYLLSFSILVSTNIQIFNNGYEPHAFWWIIQILFYLIYAFGIYLFSYQISKDKALSLISPIVGVFTLHHLYVPIYLFDPAPKAIILLLFPYLLFFIHEVFSYQIKNEFETKKIIKPFLFIVTVFVFLYLTLKNIFLLSFHTNVIDLRPADTVGIILLLFVILVLLIIRFSFKNPLHRKFLFLLFSLMCTLLFFHTYMGFFAFIFILLYVSYSIFIKEYYLIAKYLLYFSILFVFLLFMFQEIVSLNFSTFLTVFPVPISDDLGLFGFQNMKNLLSTLYSPITIWLFIFGCIYSIFYNKKLHFPLLFLVSIIFIFLFTPIEMMFRIVVFLHPIMAYFVAYGLIKIRHIYFINISHLIYSRSVIISFIILVLFLSVVGNSLNEINKVVSKIGVLSCSHPSHYTAAYALKHNTTPDTFILFYHATFRHQEICNRAGRPHYLSYTVPSPECVNEIFTSRSSIESYKKIHYLLKANDSSCEYYLTGAHRKLYELSYEKHTYKLDQMRNSSVAILLIKPDLDALYPEGANKFYDLMYFTPLYNDAKNQIYIFGVNPEPGVPFKIQNKSK